VSLQTICRLLGYTPQAYHKHQNKIMRLHLQEGMILEQIQRVRKHQPRYGGRKLFVELTSFFEQHHIKMGRDAFFDLLRRNKLLVRKLKRNVYTTMSKHHFRRYPNLAKDFTPMKAHELWVADITYIPTKHRHAYLFLITDAYSRKIVGFHLSDDMKVSSGILALKKALAQKPVEAIVIHHSDRGIQYCSTEYTNLLHQNNCMISMTQNSDPYENAIAERVNGILKTELISNYYKDPVEASRHIARCITIYNYRRRHSSLNWQVPDEVHKQYGLQKKTWRNYYYKRSKQTTQNETT
jgi:putative transposase